MGKNVQGIKRWWQVTKPHKGIFVAQFITAIIPSVCSIIAAIPTGQATTCIAIADYKGAIIHLCIAFALDLIAQISWEIQYRLDIKQLCKIYPRIHNNLFDKIFNADDANFKYTSKEKMINIISNNIVELSDFCDYISYKSAYLIRAVITLVIIFTTNFYVGLLIFAIALFVFLLIDLLNKAIGKRSLKIQEERDSLTELYGDIVDNRTLSSDLNLKAELHNKYFNQVDKLMMHYRKRKSLRSLRDNWVYLLYTFIILLATLYLIHLVSIDLLTSTIYFIITPYLTSTITKFVDFFSLFNDLQNTNISAMRIKTLLDMSEKDLIEFGKNTTDNIGGAITFTNISYSPKDKVDKSIFGIKTFNASIEKNSIVLFQGERNCGKRSLFNMLRRSIRPDTGTITFDTINIYDFDIQTYKHNISYATSKPYFFNDTIFENLRIVEDNKKRIFEICKEVGIHEKIMSLPEGYQTNLSQKPTSLSLQTKFLLGLARALLTKSEIFMIYELPVGLTEKELDTIKKVLLSIKKERTILIFSASNFMGDHVDKHFIISKGEIYKPPQTKIKQRRNYKLLENSTNSSPSSYFEGKINSKNS